MLASCCSGCMADGKKHQEASVCLFNASAVHAVQIRAIRLRRLHLALRLSMFEYSSRLVASIACADV